MQNLLLFVTLSLLNTNCIKKETNNTIVDYAEYGNLKAVQKCIANGININATDDNGNTALMWALQDGDSYSEIVEYLKSKGATE